MRCVSGIILASILSLMLGHASWADVVELKTGQRVEGNLKSAGPAGVVIEVGGQEITFKTEQVRAVYFGSAPPKPTDESRAEGDAISKFKRDIEPFYLALREMVSANASNFRARIIEARQAAQRERDRLHLQYGDNFKSAPDEVREIAKALETSYSNLASFGALAQQFGFSLVYSRPEARRWMDEAAKELNNVKEFLQAASPAAKPGAAGVR